VVHPSSLLKNQNNQEENLKNRDSGSKRNSEWLNEKKSHFSAEQPATHEVRKIELRVGGDKSKPGVRSWRANPQNWNLVSALRAKRQNTKIEKKIRTIRIDFIQG
jgi:hypothetical protein